MSTTKQNEQKAPPPPKPPSPFKELLEKQRAVRELAKSASRRIGRFRPVG